MYKTIADFIRYHNATPLILVAVLLVTGVTFAATPKGQQVFSSSFVVTDTPPVPPDINALQKTDLKKFDPGLKIDAILEDTGNFVVRYSYRTFVIEENAWKPLTKSQELKVDKKMLGTRDLGLYLADQIGQVMDREVAYLKEVQGTWRKSIDPKTTSQYATLVGKSLDQNGKEFADYRPVVKTSSQPALSRVTPVTPEQAAATDIVQAVEGKTPTEILLSKKEIQDIIVAAVANFLAIETDPTVPTTVAPTTPVIKPLPATLPASEEVPGESVEGDGVPEGEVAP